MIKIIHFFVGCLVFEIEGQNMERFLNLCAKHQIVLWNLHPKHGGYRFFIRKSRNDELRSLAQKTGVQIRLVQKTGFPFLWEKKKGGKIFFATSLLGITLFFILSRFIWEITVDGNEIYSKEEILKYVTTNFYHTGMPIRKVNCNLLEEHLREDYDEIAWVSCSIQGTRLHIEIKETLDRKTKQNSKQPCDIIANKSGKITEFSVRSGTPLVSAGDYIKKGTTLISGLIYYYSDDYQVTETDKIKADGDIVMRTVETYKETIPMEQYEKKFEEESKKIKSIYAGEYEWMLPQPKKKEHTDVIEKKYPFKIWKSLYFPVGIYVRTYRTYRSKRHIYTDAQAKAKLENRFQKYLKKREKRGIRIIRHNISYKKSGNYYVASGKIIQEEKVGKIRNIRSLTKEQERKIAPTTALQ